MNIPLKREETQMRNLSEIVEEVKSGGKPDYEELRYALLVLDFLSNMDHHTLTMDIQPDTKPFILKMYQEESFRRLKTALQQDPKEYIGWNNDPDNPGYQKCRELEIKVYEKLVNKTK
jgi:hypothetical protein